MGQRQDNKLGLTEDFFYDTLNRLDYSELNDVQNLNLSYDKIGNITARSDVGGGATWSYHATKKHAVTQAGPYSYSYDANGNAITRNGQEIKWTSYNYPYEINGPGKKLTFSYGPDASAFVRSMRTARRLRQPSTLAARSRKSLLVARRTGGTTYRPAARQSRWSAVRATE